MADDACPLPFPAGDSEAEAIASMLSSQRIAIVGLSANPARPSHRIGEYLMSVGKEIFGVNPAHQAIFGQPCFPSLDQVPSPIEMVNVFRRPEYCADIVRDAIAAGARGVWLQSGITNAVAERLARDAGLWFVQDRCIMVEHMRRKR